MLSLSSILNFGEGSGVPPSAETIFTVGNLSISNSMLMGFVVATILIVSFLVMSWRLKVSPESKFAFTLESLIAFVSDSLKNVLGSERLARKFLPLFLAFFVFILANNLFGLLPGMGGSIYVESEGLKAALLRPVTTDLNGTLGLAIIAIFTAQFFAIKERGLFGHLKHYFSAIKPWFNPINFFIGFIEILGELIRLATLALRLFGVVYAGEVLIHAIAELAGVFGPVALLPIFLLEIFFGLIQAYLFTMLSATYLSIGLQHDEEHDNINQESSTHDSNLNSHKELAKA
jgi:F-type H+-transporting ATPase subunit a